MKRPVGATLLLWMLAIGDAHAEPARVVLVADAPSDPLLPRLSAEIRALGLDVFVSRPSGQTDLATLENEARKADGIAAVQVVRAGDAVEIRIFDRVTTKLVIRRLSRNRRTDEPVIALRAVELLRGSLIEIPPAAQPPEAEVAAPPQVEALVAHTLPEPEPAPRLGLATAIAYSINPRGATSAGLARIGLSYWVQPALAFHAAVEGAFAAATVQGPEGQVSVRPLSLAAGILFAVRPITARGWFFRGGPEIGALFLFMDGEAAAPGYSAPGSRVRTALLGVRAFGGYAVTPWLRLGAESRISIALPWPEITFAGTPRGSFGMPWAGLGAGAEVLLP